MTVSLTRSLTVHDPCAPGTRTADDEELARFAAVAEAWWDPDGEFRPLHRLNPVRVAYMRDRLADHFGRSRRAIRPLSGLSALDVGCGGGLVSEPLSRLGARVTGIDAEAASIRIARAHADRVGAEVAYRCAVPEQLAAEGARFDIVVSMEVVEHVADLDAFIGACAGMLPPGGAFVAATLNRTVKALALAKIGAEYILRWLPPGTHNWRKFVRPAELAAALRRHGVELLDVTGMTYNPLVDRWTLGTDVSVNYLVFAVKG